MTVGILKRLIPHAIEKVSSNTYQRSCIIWEIHIRFLEDSRTNLIWNVYSYLMKNNRRLMQCLNWRTTYHIKQLNTPCAVVVIQEKAVIKIKLIDQIWQFSPISRRSQFQKKTLPCQIIKKIKRYWTCNVSFSVKRSFWHK